MNLDEAWEGGLLGQDELHAMMAPQAVVQEIDDQLDMALISIRLPKSLIDDFKMLASYYGTGYLPLMREALKRYCDLHNT